MGSNKKITFDCAIATASTILVASAWAQQLPPVADNPGAATVNDSGAKPKQAASTASKSSAASDEIQTITVTAQNARKIRTRWP